MLKQMLKTPERGGLTSNVSLHHKTKSHESLWRGLTITVLQNLVYRYDTTKSDDGVGGKEGTFGMCTLWLDSYFQLLSAFLTSLVGALKP